jgi:hypothetical protein
MRGKTVRVQISETGPQSKSKGSAAFVAAVTTTELYFAGQSGTWGNGGVAFIRGERGHG